MIINGTDTSSWEHETPKDTPVVKGRILHIDADFIAHMVAYDEKLPVLEMKQRARMIAARLQRLAGAEFFHMYLTPRWSTKGNRENIALLKAYQANRSNPTPKYLATIRDWMAHEFFGVMCENYEADDGMAIAQYTAIANGDRNLSVIASKDKDLRMVPGLQLNWDTGALEDTLTDFGYISLEGTGAKQKIRGRGWIFFWAQMLMGDTADNISGLPKRVEGNKLKPVGVVGTFNLLKNVASNREAFILVRDLYREYEAYATKTGGTAFLDYRTGSYVKWQDAFLSEAKLLWMRRKDDEADVINWMKETCL